MRVVWQTCDANPFLMTDDPNPPFNYIGEVGRVFRLGTGVLGKSAIAVGLFIVAGCIALWRLKSDGAILLALGILAFVLFARFFPIMLLGRKNPGAALLEGAEWTGWQRFQAAAKGFLPSPADIQPTSAPGTPEPLVPGTPTDGEEEGK